MGVINSGPFRCTETARRSAASPSLRFDFRRPGRGRDIRVSSLRVGGLVGAVGIPGPGPAGDLPLGDPVHRSPTGQYPTPAGEDWVLDARARVRGPLTGPLALHMLALPARPALTADSVLGPQRDGRAHCARRVGTPPAIRHSVPAWQCPAESGRGPPRPGGSTLFQRTGTLCPPGSAQQVPAGRPPPGQPIRRVPAIEHPVPAW